MGSCISKCRPKKRKFKEDRNEDFSHVHDKLVISQAPSSPIPLSIQKPVSPSPSAASSTSFSSFSGATSSGSSGLSAASSLSSSSSCSSSISMSKDRSFSNEFLWSCVKENPHIIGRNFIKGSHEKSGNPTKVHPRNFESPLQEKPAVLPPKQTIPEKPAGGSTPKKRARPNSPTLVRQKSFRKEPDRVSSTYHLPSRSLRSPSPSRRFNGDNSFRDSLAGSTKDINTKRSVISKASLLNSASTNLRKESFRSPSANYDKDRNIFSKSNRGIFNHEFGSKIDEIAREEVEANQDADLMLIEDINNPLIALDCFIFL